ncbi:hypothetical protein DUNSADRAFT_8215 [Dunaliella salina]|uniref:Uncharacterized protein n=1 Tax=Dunaliella salina TaxID=3046 RepID=A0ABQ7GJZ3_DUNSA|nr:hypothetical protein DUNSADRAFT_8215 [Dunaliella salina]|eukprot:KAF5834879.1 hypothetical protein DUNSADRAFT_8215 [Dunaliella salina]
MSDKPDKEGKEEWINGATDVFFNPLGDTEYGNDEELGYPSKVQFQRLGGKRIEGFDDDDRSPVIDPFFFNSDVRPKERIRFFLEIDFTDQEVLERLPEPFANDPPAQGRILQIVSSGLWALRHEFFVS